MRTFEAPAARLLERGGTRLLGLPEVEAVMGSDALVIDALRGMVRNGPVTVPLGGRPVLFTLVLALAEAWPSDVSREALLIRAFRARHADESHRARLRVEIGRLRSAISELADIRATENGFILRPLLHWRRDELVRLALDEDLPFVDDPSNADSRFDRARLRHALSSQTVLDVEAAARSADWLAEADDAIDWAVERLIAAWPDASDIAVIRDEGYPPEIFRRVVTQRLRANAAGLPLRGASLDGVVKAMHQGRRAMVGELLIDAVRGLEGTIWRISAAPRRNIGVRTDKKG